MHLRVIASTALLLSFVPGGQVLALTEAERKLMRPTEVKCPASNKGRFELLEGNVNGDYSRTVWQFEGKKTVFLTLEYKDVKNPWFMWLNETPNSPDWADILKSAIPGFLKEACGGKGVRRAFAVKVQASRKVLGLAPLKQTLP